MQKTLIPGAGPKRPDWYSVTDKVAEMLLPRVVQWLKDESGDGVLKQLQDALEDCITWDGYELASDLERSGWSPDSELVDILDGASHLQYTAHQEAVAKWAQDWGIKPEFAVGDEVKTDGGNGFVVSVDEKHATYTVSIPSKGHIGHIPKEQRTHHSYTIGDIVAFESVTKPA